MSRYSIISIGASAGGVEALIQLVQRLPSDLAASLLVVLHFPPDRASALPQVLSRNSGLPASHPQDGEAIQPSHIYIAPPDHHLIVAPGCLHLNQDPPETGHRPAIDPLFRSVARVYGQQAIGVILSGTREDGAAGLALIKSCGGVAIVQHPAEARFIGMPHHALQATPVDYVGKIVEIATVLTSLVQDPIGEQPDRGVEDSAG
ncbi:hypothetical protein BST81_11360 [Leptolyngbya sp. 'hensonii']|uniref:chemotaxis protein CheB n=1 Tax=Leptolyngbya sp. 'hensonii' TaxID=1922337 RepID=UPI00094F7819|nr:chemotaxis protein CheB [Leptolyngbya sp. 'hensonii']OLP18314.1 hypothetical protein BST81_11360 [Leptolyngbya sp. 'hensonii']